MGIQNFIKSMDNVMQVIQMASSTNSNSSTSLSLTESLSDSESEESIKRPRLGSWKRTSKSGGKFRCSLRLPFILTNTKGEKFAYCILCSHDFSVTHGGHNDVKRKVLCTFNIISHHMQHMGLSLFQ